MDVMIPLLYTINVKIILDNSGSMGLDMFGNDTFASYSSSDFISQVSQGPISYSFPDPTYNPRSVPIDPRHRRWFFARDALMKWMRVFQAMGLHPPIYLLNAIGGQLKLDPSQLDRIFGTTPSGSTPMTECIQRTLDDHRMESRIGGTQQNSLLLLILTDGEANNMQTFNKLLDSIQNRIHGDVQACLLGLSLRKEDIEWFENEECEDTRIRTIEPFEIEQYQILRREVVKKEGQYNFDMHTFRALVTNFLPADYDYEAPNQNLRHRIYVTFHGKDRWWSESNCFWSCLSSICGWCVCTPCYLLSCCCCGGYCQGYECGKCRKTECLESCSAGE